MDEDKKKNISENINPSSSAKKDISGYDSKVEISPTSLNTDEVSNTSSIEVDETVVVKSENLKIEITEQSSTDIPVNENHLNDEAIISSIEEKKLETENFEINPQEGLSEKNKDEDFSLETDKENISKIEGNEDSISLKENTKKRDTIKKSKEKKVVQKSELQKVKAELMFGQVNELNIFQQADSYPKKEKAIYSSLEQTSAEKVKIFPNQDEAFIDPSKFLKNEPEKFPTFITAEVIKTQFSILKKERVIVTTCTDEKIAYDTARKLAFQFNNEDYELRKILVGRGDNSNKLNIDIFLEETIGRGEKMVIVIDIKSPIFFGSILSMQYSFSETLKEALRDKNIFLILSISSELWINDIKEQGKEFYFKTWEIPFEKQVQYSTEEKKKIEQLIPEKEDLKKIILYTITFFPGLNQEDFEYIILLLLNTVNKKKKKKEKMKEDWFERPDYFLIKCGIFKTYSESHDSDIMDFKNTHQRVSLKQYFNRNHSFYIKQKFESLFTSGLLFNMTTNEQITNNLINLLLKKLASNTKEYSFNYLLKITKLHFFSNSVDTLSQVIDEMLSNEKLKESVKGFLNFYMEENREVVQMLTEKLRYSPNFDKFYWLGRLLNEGNKATRDRSYNFLINLSKQIGIRVFEFLNEIKNWLPHLETPINNFSPVNMYGLTFIIDFTNEITKKFPVSKFGYFPSNYPLFVTLDGDKEATSEKIKLLISWLFHPSLEDALILLRRIHSDNHNTNAKKVKREILQFRAHLIEVWYAILLWKIKDEDIETKDRESLNLIANQLVNEVYLQASEDNRRKLDKIWGNKSIRYTKLSSGHLKKLSEIKNLHSLERQQLLESRALILKSYFMINKLRDQFKKLIIIKNINI